MPNDGKLAVVPPATGSDGPVYDDDYRELAGEEESLGSPDNDEDEGDDDREAESVDSDAVSSEEEDEESEEEDSDEGDQEDETDSEKPKIPFDRPTVRELKAEYPDLFKKFPTLRESFFREIEFTKIFPTVEDAKEAFESSESFDQLSDAVLSGNPVPLLESIEKADKKALEVFSLSFLPALYKRDQELYSSTVTPLFQNLVRQIYKSGDENTKNAALVVSDFLFGRDGEDVAIGKKSLAKSTEPSEEQKKLKEERDTKISAQFRETYTKVETDINSSLRVIIMKDFDPERVFSKFLREQGAKEIIERIKDQLKADPGHLQVMSARWKKAKSNGYSDSDRSKIVSTFLARAKSLIPRIREKVRADMLGDKEKSVRKMRENGRPAPKEHVSGRHSGRSSSRPTVDYSKMTDLEILDS